MADLSHLPVNDPEVDVLDLDGYEPPSEQPSPLPVGNYVVKLIDGEYDRKETDPNGTERVVAKVPILFDVTEKGFLKATFTCESLGRLDRDAATKVEILTDEQAGRKIPFQRINRAPFKKGNRKGANMMADLLYAFGYRGSLQSNQEYADAMEACMGKAAKAYIIRRRGIDTGQIKDGRKVYKEFKNDDFDADGELKAEHVDALRAMGVDLAEPPRAFNEIAGLYPADRFWWM